jgi:DNA polymerase III subunit gamma/tau
MTDVAETVNAPAYRVLARKYRPKNFSGLIGQEAMVRTLTNAIATNRIAQAYMLTGVRGVGKTTTARLIARALNYPGAPSIEMPEMTPQCEAILESRHMDVIEMDAASNTGVDNMREIIDSVRYAPVSLRYKVYIIDEVHMLSKSAFNALLKTLEEPPPHVKFIFATTEIRKVPVTILSRCQRFDLKRLDAALLMQHYARIAALENVTIDDESLRMVARASEGSVRDGLSLLDQAIAYGEGVVKSADVASMMGLIDKSRIIDLFDAVMSGDTAKAIREVETQYEGGGDPETILNDLADFVHWVTRLKVVKDAALIDASRTEIEKARGAEYATRIGMAHLARAWQMLLKGIAEVGFAAQPLLAAEMVLIRLAHAADIPQGEELLKMAKPAVPEKSAAIVMPQSSRRETQAPETMGSLAVKVDIQPQQTPTEPVAFSTFADIIAIAVEKRDVKLKGDLERFVRPIRVAPGQIELALEQGASPGLPGELSRKLEAWTGRRWMVLVAREGGDKPLALQKKDARESAFREVREDPNVQAILKRFPGATVTDVRDPETLKPMEDNDEEPR